MQIYTSMYATSTFCTHACLPVCLPGVSLDVYLSTTGHGMGPGQTWRYFWTFAGYPHEVALLSLSSQLVSARFVLHPQFQDPSLSTGARRWLRGWPRFSSRRYFSWGDREGRKKGREARQWLVRVAQECDLMPGISLDQSDFYSTLNV